jgi:glycosyltransferase involved in cell wall biosynthesis
MAVYNSEKHLATTLESILTQENVDLEFIVVNDGSTDTTEDILHQYTGQYPQLKIITQDNQGITCSLIRGCAAAKGEFIARQDAGDISLPGRLQKELHCLSRHPQASMVSCGTNFLGPKGESLYTIVQTEDEGRNGLRRLVLSEIKGPSHHGSVMFRRDAYEQVGGYRKQFFVAQDLDLWLRLTEVGGHVAMQEVLYQSTLASTSISSRMRDVQFSTAQLIMECASRRRSRESEQDILEQASILSPQKMNIRKKSQAAAFDYFLGCCLLKKDPAAAQKYFFTTLQKDPLHLRAGLRFLQAKMKS